MADTAGKRDLKRELKALYSAPADPVVVDVPPLSALMIDGAGDPNTAPAFAAAIEALYSVAYTLKFMVKKGPLGIDYGVLPLEALWWADDMGVFTAGSDRAAWRWTALIVQPDFVTAAMVAEAIAGAKKKAPDRDLSALRFGTFNEGRAAQLMHTGPYSAEGPNISRLHEFIAAQGGHLTGRHHEIYLSDMRRTAPEKLKTIIRQPFAV